MRDMLKCEISMILVSEYTRGEATGRSSSCATWHSARTNSTMASLSSRPLRTSRRHRQRVLQNPFLQPSSKPLSLTILLSSLAG